MTAKSRKQCNLLKGKASREILKTLLSKLLPSRFHDFFFSLRKTHQKFDGEILGIFQGLKKTALESDL